MKEKNTNFNKPAGIGTGIITLAIFLYLLECDDNNNHQAKN